MNLSLWNFAVTRSGLYYMSQPEPQFSTKPIRFLSFADHQTRLVASIKQNVYHGFSVSPDERWLLYAPYVAMGSTLMLIENFELDGALW